jgi:3-hydroxyisobutyrate dehydrogenase-like beta-hydroxyacid dehydrogenase
MNASRIGIIGLGLVGRALAARLLAAGFPVGGFDVSAPAVEAAAAIGVAPAGDLSELLGCSSIALVCVFDDPQLSAVVAQIVATAAADRASRSLELVINTATCSPAAVEAAAASMAAAAIAFLELPLSGSSAAIRAGEALGLVGADASTLARHLALVNLLSPRHVHVGLPGSAARAKLATNLILGLNRAALAEGIFFAERLGLDGHRFLELLRQSPAYSRAVDTVGERMVTRDFTPRSRLAQHRKDLALILAQATALDAGLPLAQAHAALLDRAVEAGLGEADNAAVIAALATKDGGPNRNR